MSCAMSRMPRMEQSYSGSAGLSRDSGHVDSAKYKAKASFQLFFYFSLPCLFLDAHPGDSPPQWLPLFLFSLLPSSLSYVFVQ
jgi:hypothetical protein